MFFCGNMVNFATSDNLVIVLLFITGLLVLSCVSWNIYYGRIWRGGQSMSPLPPGNMGIPLLGEMIAFVREGPSGEFFRRRHARYGRVYKTHILGMPVIQLSGSQNVKKILLNEHILVEAAWPTSMHCLLGNSALSMTSGDQHRRLKKTFFRCLSKELVNQLAWKLDCTIAKWLQRWCGKSVSVYDEAKLMTLEAALQCLLGIDDVSLEECQAMAQDLDVFAAGLFSLPVRLPGTAFYKAKKAKERILKQLRFMADRSSSRAFPSVIPVTNLTNIASNQPGLTLSAECITDTTLEILFGGQETAASLITSLIVYLHRYPDVLGEMRKEIRDLRISSDTSAAIPLDCFNTLNYTQAVIKETLRLNPPITGGFRRVLRTFELEGYQIPRGWTLGYNIRETHRSSDIFKNPDHFDPSRWLHSEDCSPISFHFLPFGAGARSCIGKEYAKLIIQMTTVALVRKFKWNVTEPYPPILCLPTVRPKGKLEAVFMPLSKCD